MSTSYFVCRSPDLFRMHHPNSHVEALFRIIFEQISTIYKEYVFVATLSPKRHLILYFDVLFHMRRPISYVQIKGLVQTLCDYRLPIVKTQSLTKYN